MKQQRVAWEEVKRTLHNVGTVEKRAAAILRAELQWEDFLHLPTWSSDSDPIGEGAAAADWIAEKSL